MKYSLLRLDSGSPQGQEPPAYLLITFLDRRIWTFTGINPLICFLMDHVDFCQVDCNQFFPDLISLEPVDRISFTHADEVATIIAIDDITQALQSLESKLDMSAYTVNPTLISTF